MLTAIATVLVGSGGLFFLISQVQRFIDRRGEKKTHGEIIERLDFLPIIAEQMGQTSDSMKG